MYYFGNNGAPEYWLGSADLMHRNLDRRVEVLCQVADRDACANISDMLDLAFSADTAAWDQQPDGTWARSGGTVDYQESMMRRLADRGE